MIGIFRASTDLCSFLESLHSPWFLLRWLKFILWSVVVLCCDQLLQLFVSDSTAMCIPYIRYFVWVNLHLSVILFSLFQCPIYIRMGWNLFGLSPTLIHHIHYMLIAGNSVKDRLHFSISLDKSCSGMSFLAVRLVLNRALFCYLEMISRVLYRQSRNFLVVLSIRALPSSWDISYVTLYISINGVKQRWSLVGGLSIGKLQLPIAQPWKFIKFMR